MSAWMPLDTGGHVTVYVKDMVLKGKGKRAVGVSSDCVCVYSKPYDEDWKFFDNEDQSWALGSSASNERFIENSGNVFSKEQQEDILSQCIAAQ